MEVIIKPLSGCEYELELIVPQQELQPHFDKAYAKVRSEITLPGFRKGKAPLLLIKGKLGRAIEADTIESLSNDLFKQAMEERNIKPIGKPHMDFLDHKPGEALTMRIQYETAPDVYAHDYRGIEAERIIREATDDDVDREIEYLRQRHSTYTDAEKAEDEHHLVTVDIQELSDSGVPIIGRKNEDVKILLSNERGNRDLKAELLNMRTGEEKNVELTYGGNDGAEDYNRVRLHVKKIERMNLPDVDNAFAQKVSGNKFETIDQLRCDMKVEIQRMYDHQAKSALEGQIVQEVVKRNQFDVPPSLVDKILDGFIDQLKGQNKQETLPPNFDVIVFKKSRRADAVWQARWMFIRQSIIKQEALAVEDGDVEARAEEQAGRTGIAKDRLIQFFKQSEETADSILREKVITFLVDNAIVKEVNLNTIEEPLIQLWAD